MARPKVSSTQTSRTCTAPAAETASEALAAELFVGVTDRQPYDHHHQGCCRQQKAASVAAGAATAEAATAVAPADTVQTATDARES